MLEKLKKREQCHCRIRSRIFGTATRPRLCVFRSLKHIYAQLINDDKGETVVAASDLELKKKIKSKKRTEIKKKEFKKSLKPFVGKTAVAYEVGRLIAEKALKGKIKRVVFDRGGFKYHGRVKALAEGAREGGLEF